VKVTKRSARIGVHGESLGGAVACHMANKFDINFLFADRTFSSLADVAHFSFGAPLKKLFRIVYGDFSTANDFYYAT
jgi:hypothetical protein